MREQRSQQWKKDVTTWDHLFGLTDKAMWSYWSNFWGQNQLSRVSLDSQSNFSGVRIDLFTDKAAILSLLDLRIIMG